MSLQDTVMRTVNRVASALYRVSGGRVGGQAGGVPVALLTVAGRKSGEPHTNPVVFFEVGKDLLVVGSYNGSDTEPQWFRNLRAADTASIERRGNTQEVAVRIADSAERDRLWRDVVLPRGKSFAGYERKTTRVIPIAVLTP